MNYSKLVAVLLLHVSLLSLHADSLPAKVEKKILTAPYPVITCSAAEAKRLQAAWQKGSGKVYDAAAYKVKRAEQYLTEKVTYPPRGGQHNQWYQCDACEVALVTINDHQHQCPKCKKNYSGYPYDDVIFAQKHSRNLNMMTDTAWAWLISGRKQYAQFAKQILLGYAERYKQYPFHGNSKWNLAYIMLSGGHLYEQTLNEAYMLSTRIAPAYDLVKAAGVISPEEDQKIINGLLLPMLKNICKYKAGKNNWQTWHNAAMLWGGAVIRQPEWVKLAIDDPVNGFLRQMQISILDDGMWYEGSWGYHFYAQQALILTAEGARRLGLDLWAQPKMRKTFTYPLNWCMPGNTLPRFGDSVSPSLKRCKYLWEPAYHAYQMDELLPLLSAKPNFKSVLYGRDTTKKGTSRKLQSTVFINSGHAILRSQSPAELTVAVTFGPHGGYHGHYDKLGFVMYGYGRELAVDPGRAASQAYRLPIHKQWYKAGISHNVLLVNQKSQRACRGKLLLFKDKLALTETNSVSVLLVANNNAYPSVSHKRLFLLFENYLLIWDQLHSSRSQRYDWLYHNRGNSITANKEFTKIKADSDFPGMQYLRDISTLTTDTALHIKISDKPVSTWVLPAPADQTTYVTATGPGSSIDSRVPMVMINRHGKTAGFATVIEPVPSGKSGQVQSIRFVGKDQVEINDKNGSELITLTGQSVRINQKTLNY